MAANSSLSVIWVIFFYLQFQCTAKKKKRGGGADKIQYQTSSNGQQKQQMIAFQNDQINYNSMTGM